MVKRLTPDEIGRWLSRGRRLLRRGRSQEAGLVFGRILVREPGHAGARQGRREAEAAEAEQERRALVRLEEGERALLAGDVARGRDLTVEGVPTAGDHERAGELPHYQDRPPRPAASAEVALGGAETEFRRGEGWHRHALVALWALGFALLASTVASTWERLLDGLAGVPSPRAMALPTSPAGPVSPADPALAEARRLIEEGDARGALAAIDRVTPQDPGYPSALRYRSQAETLLREGGSRR
ncbi:MAG TPA: hypothetical protein VKI41_05290 [Vicinamibacteria bacterium]|nr:hypothetical protein [Vicinamibacteria bacterium]